MPKRDARKSSSKKSARITSTETLKMLERKVIAIGEQLGRVAAVAEEKADAGLNRPAFRSHLAEIRARISQLLERIRAGSLSAGVDRRRAREQSREKVAAPGKKHRRAPEAAHSVKHSDELISKALATRRRRSGRPREG
jgi:hypothetical protein